MQLLNPIRIGNLELHNRIFLAPLTRSRAGKHNIPNELMAEYYTQRAGAGLLISEATVISDMAYGYLEVPGIYRKDQIEGWKIVTNSVHKADSRIFCQLWHVGRISHTSFLNGKEPLAPSAINAGGPIRTYEGVLEKSTPRALEIDEIKTIIQQYAQAAENAIEAGFDGVEIHGANGYLIEQFICTSANQRSDEYGGTIENRSKFLFEVIDAIIKRIGKERTGLRLSPSGITNGSYLENPVQDYEYIIGKLNDYDLAYLHIIEPYNTVPTAEHKQYLLEPTIHFRKFYNGVLISNSGYTPETAEIAIQENVADAIAFGKSFISNPDLVYRIKNKLELTPPNPKTFYAFGPEGYTDYPFAKS